MADNGEKLKLCNQSKSTKSKVWQYFGKQG